MNRAPIRIAILLALAFPLAGCSMFRAGPATYASLPADPRATAPEGFEPESWTGEPERPHRAGTRASGLVDPVSALQKSRRETSRWLDDPASRRSVAAGLTAPKLIPNIPTRNVGRVDGDDVARQGF